MAGFVSENPLRAESKGLKLSYNGLSVLITAHLGQKSHFSTGFVGSHSLIGSLSPKRGIEFTSRYRLPQLG